MSIHFRSSNVRLWCHNIYIGKQCWNRTEEIFVNCDGWFTSKYTENKEFFFFFFWLSPVLSCSKFVVKFQRLAVAFLLKSEINAIFSVWNGGNPTGDSSFVDGNCDFQPGKSTTCCSAATTTATRQHTISHYIGKCQCCWVFWTVYKNCISMLCL